MKLIRRYREKKEKGKSAQLPRKKQLILPASASPRDVR